MGIQSFGESFELTKLIRARDRAREMTFELAASLRPGMTEDDAHGLYKELSRKFGVEKQWHPPKLRFGKNTLKNFREPSAPHVLQEEDIFFIDIGPVFENHEADYGETFTLGNEFEHKLIANASRKLFDLVSAFWKTERPSGQRLYGFAEAEARRLGYHLNLGSDGHRIGDFPHQIHFKGSLEECQDSVVPNAWILEIHLWNPQRTFGAFFEDLLTDHPL